MCGRRIQYKEQIDGIEAGDIAFVYQNRVGIIAFGTATGVVEVSAFEGHKAEQHRMQLRRFSELRSPIAPGTIVGISERLLKRGVYFARTVAHIDSKLGEELYRLAQKSTQGVTRKRGKGNTGSKSGSADID